MTPKIWPSSLKEGLASRRRDVLDEALKLGKGVAFVKSQFKRLPQEDETWEADFRALPKPMTQTATHYLGMVLTQPHGYFLAQSEVERAPTVNDLATLLANAMKRPFVEGAHRPKRLHVRGNPRWKSLFPHLKEIGVEVVAQKILPKVEEAYQEYLKEMKKAHAADKIKPTAQQVAVEKTFPAIAKWVNGYGHIEIGDQEMSGFVVRAVDYGGVVFEDDRPRTLAEAMASLEKSLVEWFEKEGIEVD
jgi:hypothetical protein